MENLTVENRIEALYGCTIIQYFKRCVDRDMDAHEIAQDIKCSVSNLRRIARKYKFTFHNPKPCPMLAQDVQFTSKPLNNNNILSRSWRQQRA